MASRSRPGSSLSTDKLPGTIVGIGVLLFFAFVVEWVVFYGIRVQPLLTGDFLLGLLLTAVFSGGISYAGYWLERSDLSPERYSRLAKWFVGGIALFLAVNAPMMVVWYPGTLRGVVGWARFSMTMGGTVGLVFGIIEARAIQRELTAERAAVRAEETETQRQWLDYLNSLLRHEVLNSANVITGYASVHLDDEDLDDELRRDLERIHRQGQDMTEVIRDVKVLIRATQGNAELGVVNLTEVLTAELDDLRATSESVAVDASIPDGVHVVADDLLARVFANLFTNAVQHNDSDTPRVDVTVETGAETVSVSVADNGPGIPVDDRDTLFDRGENTGASHGLGLYLVRTLVERYGGTIRLSETGADGSVFTVELPLADGDTADQVPVLRSDPPRAA